MSINAVFGYRRIAERKNCFFAAGYVLLDDRPCTAGFEDISPTGAGIVTDLPLPLKTHVKLALNTRKKGLILIDSRVCWIKRVHNGWRSGLMFDRRLPFEPTMIF